MAERRRKRIANALDVARLGTVDGEPQKMWVIDQMVRALLPDQRAYQHWVQDLAYEGDRWDTGTAPRDGETPAGV